jgi:hypothetical protein
MAKLDMRAGLSWAQSQCGMDGEQNMDEGWTRYSSSSIAVCCVIRHREEHACWEVR